MGRQGLTHVGVPLLQFQSSVTACHQRPNSVRRRAGGVMISRPAFHRRDILVALAFGLALTIGFCAWYDAVGQAVAVGNYLWLARLQEPGIRSGEWVLYTLYPVIGNPWSVRIAIVVAYAVLFGMWTLVSFAITILARLTTSLLRARRTKASA